MIKRFIALLLVSCVLLTACETNWEPHQSITYVMDTVVEQVWYGKYADKIIDEINDELKRLENTFSPYIETSEIYKINHNPNIDIGVSDEVFMLAQTALSYCEISEGLFDISIGPLVNLWDITSGNETVPSDDEIAKAKSHIDYKNVELKVNIKNNNSIKIQEGMALDFGAVLKGYAAACCQVIAQHYNVSGWVSIGGNMYVQKKNPQTGKDFKIGIRDPFGDESSYFASVVIPNTTMSTAGTYERFFIKDGVRYHHILNPFTGYPAESDLCSVTIISNDGTFADIMATTILMKGSNFVKEYAERFGCQIIAVTNEKEVILGHEDKTISIPSYPVVSGVGA